MKTIEELKIEREKIKDQLKSIDSEIADILSKTLVRCLNKDCLRGYEVRELSYIQTHWYETPSGCTDGDKWHEGEGQWQCPVCKWLMRLYDRPDIVKLKKFFKEVIDKY